MEINMLNEKPKPKFFKDDIVFSLRHFVKHVEYSDRRNEHKLGNQLAINT